MAYFEDFGFRPKGANEYIHSSDLKIKRVNSGSRAELLLTPTFKDNTQTIPGRDGLIYFNTNIQQQKLKISFAYNELTEKEINKIMRTFKADTIGYLILDEAPFKEYEVKLESQPKLSYLVFGNNGQRIYKGEGELTFVGYYPYARNRFTKLEDANTDPYITAHLSGEDETEWADAANFINSEDATLDIWDGTKFSIYNGGITNTPFELKLKLTAGQKGPIVIRYDDTPKMVIDVSELDNKELIIDTENNSIIYDGTIINDLLIAGDFFKVAPSIGNTFTHLSIAPTTYFESAAAHPDRPTIRYNYLYL